MSTGVIDRSIGVTGTVSIEINVETVISIRSVRADAGRIDVVELNVWTNVWWRSKCGSLVRSIRNDSEGVVRRRVVSSSSSSSSIVFGGSFSFLLWFWLWGW